MASAGAADVANPLHGHAHGSRGSMTNDISNIHYYTTGPSSVETQRHRRGKTAIMTRVIPAPHDAQLRRSHERTVTMEYRRLGRAGVRVSVIGPGLFGDYWRHVPGARPT